jgi:DNA anti-recombination protein RmuC
MKHIFIPLALCATALAALSACGNDGAPSSSKVTVDQAQQKAQEAADTAAQYARQQRDEYVRRAQQELDDLHAKIEDLRAQAAQSGADARDRLDQQIAALQDQWNRSRDRLDKLKRASGEAWQEIQTGVGNALDELKKSYEKAKAKFD